jgi:hypothetical protein
MDGKGNGSNGLPANLQLLALIFKFFSWIFYLSSKKLLLRGTVLPDYIGLREVPFQRFELGQQTHRVLEF